MQHGQINFTILTNTGNCNATTNNGKQLATHLMFAIEARIGYHFRFHKHLMSNRHIKIQYASRCTCIPANSIYSRPLSVPFILVLRTDKLACPIYRGMRSCTIFSMCSKKKIAWKSEKTILKQHYNFGLSAPISVSSPVLL